jgi:site-specific recombinase XerC
MEVETVGERVGEKLGEKAGERVVATVEVKWAAVLLLAEVKAVGKEEEKRQLPVEEIEEVVLKNWKRLKGLVLQQP